MDDVDIWLTANLLIETHGENAGLQAALRADNALDGGFPGIVNVWMRVMRAIEELQRTSLKPDEALN